ncbi:isoprenylcysteine carboxylmethyltransferase family protein [bacterium]|nr:isoprenylcysteine carboxylmethyltransferase family protein [bacterium]
MDNSISAFVFKNRRFFSIISLIAVMGLKVYLKGTTSLFLLGTGLIIVAIGIVFRMYCASYLLGRHIVTKVEAEFLCVSGPFAHLRNPLYLGNFIICLGSCIAFNEWYAYLIGFGNFIFLYSFIIPHEEEFLQEKFGDNYLEYKANIKRFIPRITGYKSHTEIFPNYKLGILREISHLIVLVVLFVVLFVCFV